jgi:NADPH2:quinone reductase
MKAALYRRTGPAADVLEVADIDVPDPGPNEVRVKIEASGINPTDWKTRGGLSGADPEDFQVPHQDGVGIVDAVGADVDGPLVQERVWMYLAAFGNRWGTAAEYAVVPADRVVRMPASASVDLGACLGVPAVTAAHCLGDRDALNNGTVLVAGGAGAVGHYAIELAKQAGAWVVTTVSSPEKAELAQAAGADLVVNYRDDDAIDQIRSFAPRVDRIVEVALGANLEIDLAVAGAGTVIAVYANEAQDPVVPTRRFMIANATITYVLLYGVPSEEIAKAVAWTSDALEAGALSALPVTRYALDDIVAAHEAVEGGAVGKVLVIP